MPLPNPGKDAIAAFEKISADLVSESGGVRQTKMFGMPSLQVKGKMFAGVWGNALVFKLTGEEHKKALALKGAKLFDPSGMGRAMKEWVQIPAAHSRQWRKYARAAMEYVAKGK